MNSNLLYEIIIKLNISYEMYKIWDAKDINDSMKYCKTFSFAMVLWDVIISMVLLKWMGIG